MIDESWTRPRRFALPRLLPRRLRSLHTLVLVLVLAGLGWVGWTWYRGSSFVRVRQVTVTGLAGPDVPQIRDALRQSALTMSTLNLSVPKLLASVDQYAYVQSLSVSRDGSHAVTIHVEEDVPVALVQIGGSDEVIDAQDRLIAGTTMTRGALPLVTLKQAPAGTTITAPGTRGAIAVLGAAPYSMLAHIASASSSSAHGVVLQLRNGPALYFGPVTQLAAKWTAAIAVLADHDSAGAAYIDLSDPQRPAAGADAGTSQVSDTPSSST